MRYIRKKPDCSERRYAPGAVKTAWPHPRSGSKYNAFSTDLMHKNRIAQAIRLIVSQLKNVL
ncbi:MAG TPA: hypothetical protein VK404_16965 [Spirosoma sp.]|jgi:hypothetical protein|nr:hypothetical protein [Spirosoma sp.]